VPIGRRINNFGDLLGPLIVGRILSMQGIDVSQAVRDRRLLTIGSILHLARNGDVIWGTGVNGKVPDEHHDFDTLDVRAVRGPVTQQLLLSRGIEAPAVFGDPGLLLPVVVPELRNWTRTRRHRLTIVPNFNDYQKYDAHPDLLDPRSPVFVCLRRLAESELVVGSSLHAIVVAESLGIPARLVSSGAEAPLKYEDYFLGTGRQRLRTARSVEQAVKMDGEEPAIFDAGELLAAFPSDLWARPGGDDDEQQS
jgi:pyruvyltransferase